MAVRYPEPGNLFTGVSYAAVASAPHVADSGAYSAPSVISPTQFSQEGMGFRYVQKMGSMRILHSKHGTKISTAGGGFRTATSGRLSHMLKAE